MVYTLSSDDCSQVINFSGGKIITDELNIVADCNSIKGRMEKCIKLIKMYCKYVNNYLCFQTLVINTKQYNKIIMSI